MHLNAVTLLLNSSSNFFFPPLPLKAEAMEMDGFQADTEEDEDDDDCMIVDVQPCKGGEKILDSRLLADNH